MNYLVPYKLSEINLNKISFKNIKESENRKIIFIKYKDPTYKNMVFQLPTLINNTTVDGNEIMMKITTKQDLKIAEYLYTSMDTHNGD